ncbi:TonB-dependent receptor [Microbulbifer sp. MKSA007]|nr:TonB-dependent receptor [Microbulbifer sp. MKSA007]
MAVDISRSDNKQWSQEFRLQTSFDGPWNFSVGTNYLDFKTQDDYFVFNNIFSMVAQYLYNADRDENFNLVFQNCTDPEVNVGSDCIYVDPNSIENIDEEGHNYFLSRNLVEVNSWALFGETYWQINDDVKLTTGLRYTNDRKRSTPVPSQLLLGTFYDPVTGEVSSGEVSGGLSIEAIRKVIRLLRTGRSTPGVQFWTGERICPLRMKLCSICPLRTAIKVVVLTLPEPRLIQQ